MPITTAPHIHQLLTPDRIRVGLPGTSKEAVLDALLALIAAHPAVMDAAAVRAAVFARERIMSTGVGKGLGLPHAKTPAVTETVAAFAVTETPVDFGAIDDEPVRLVFLLVGTEQSKSEHIKILSRISRLLNRDAFRHRLLEAETPDEILRLLEDGELRLVEG